MPPTPKTDILETTLRDGSYVIDFQFTANDTRLIGAALERAGFNFIEIGHGIGLGASRGGFGEAAETDEAYAAAAADTFRKARWGMFCIPGIASLEDVDMCAEHGMKFLRVGANVTEIDTMREFIERGKKYGMFVSANMMKSYAISPAEFAQHAVTIQKFGADILCIVDSAGGMLTEEMTAYFEAVRASCDIPLGFHGHNNLELAVANSLKAVELGAALIDTSLQGMGRSAGNTPTEILLSILARKGVDYGIDLIEIMDIGEHFIKPLLTRHGYNSVDTVSGFAQFHSSYMKTIRKYSEAHGVDPRKLIMGVCERNKVDAPPELVEAVAKGLAEKGETLHTARFRLDRFHGSEQNAGS